MVDRIRAGHFNDGSIDDSREFLTANPAPCMRVSFCSFPCQKSVFCLLMVVWSPVRQQSQLCFNFSSSQLMMAVFLESFTRCELSERTGQLAKRKVGDLIFLRGILLLCIRFPSDFHAYY